jgi:hypothetical protein
VSFLGFVSRFAVHSLLKNLSPDARGGGPIDMWYPAQDAAGLESVHDAGENSASSTVS